VYDIVSPLGFIDIDVAITSEKIKYGSFYSRVRSFEYIMRNNANVYVWKKITEYAQRHIVRVIGKNDDLLTSLNDVLKTANAQKGTKCNGGGYCLIEKLVTYSNPLIKPPILVDVETSRTERLVGSVIDYMNKHHLVVCDSMIFKKVKGSKMTYKPFYKEIDSFLDAFGSKIKLSGSFIKIRPVLACIFKTTQLLEDYDNIEFPRITISYRMVEFGDFFYNTMTHKIYVKQSEFYCFCYNPQIMLNTFKKNILFWLENGIWTRLIRSCGFMNLLFMTTIYGWFRPHLVKDPNALIVGESNSGKSIIVSICDAFYAKHKIGNVSNLSEHQIYDMVYQKLFVVMGESNTLYNSAVENGTVLKMLGHEVIVADKKHGQMVDFHSNAAIASTMNARSTDSYHEHPALMNRHNVFYANGGDYVLPEENVVTETQTLLLEEIGFVVFVYRNVSFS
jgi:hypothetical protein